MQSRPIHDYIWLGTALRYLQDASAQIRVQGHGNVVYNIDHLLEQLVQFELVVTARAAHKLEEIRAELAAADATAGLSAEQARRLQTIVTDLRQTLEAEAGGNVAFIVRDKRYDVKRLLSAVGIFFAPHVYESLPPIAQHDFAEAGRCIAFELPTAGALCLTRATEDVLRTFYKAKVKRNRSSLMWGPMVDSLKAHGKKLPAVLLSDLDSMRDYFRNPTQHPEKIYDLDEAQDLFGRCIDIVNRMMKVLG